MRRSVEKRWRVLSRASAVALAFSFPVALAGECIAQCVMCGSGTPYAGSSPQRTAIALAAAALVLLVPALLVLAGAARYLWKMRNEE